MEQQEYIVWLESLRMSDVAKVGGKNASLGEMISQLAHLGVRVPGGFATTAEAYRNFLAQDDLDKRIRAVLDNLDVTDVIALAEVGSRIRQWIIDTPLPPRLESEVRGVYEKMQAEAGVNISWAIRSSATAEDLPDASFAGQQETFLNINGVDH
ncbi:MAG: PEP/pyruvate-binding domain-containing protein, partial [Candidatus Nitrotoga sp.]